MDKCWRDVQQVLWFPSVSLTVCCIPRPGFSRNSPVWLLGAAYHRKLVVGPEGEEGGGSPVGGQVNTFTETDSGIEAFENDYRSKVRLDDQ